MEGLVYPSWVHTVSLCVSWELLCINWNEPLYWQTLNKAWVGAGGCKQTLPRYPQGQSRICYQERLPLVIIVNKKNLAAHTKGLQRCGLHCCDRCRSPTQMYNNNCTETHFGGGDMSPFVFLLIATARSLLRHHVYVCGDANAGPHDVAKQCTTRIA